MQYLILNFFAVLLGVLCTHGSAYGSHPYDTRGEARQRLVFNTEEAELMSLDGATIDSLRLACSGAYAYDVWEVATVPSSVEPYSFFYVGLSYITDSLDLYLEVWSAADTLVSCQSIGWQDQSITYSLQSGATYYFRYYTEDVDTIGLQIATSYGHNEGIQRCPKELVFAQQTLVDLFPTDYPYCDTYGSNLSIQGTVHDLQPLQQLTSIRGFINISGATALESLDGLNGIEQCGGLSIAFNPLLTSMSGLAGLERVDGVFNILFNPRLQGDVLLPQLDTVDGSILISLNDSLSSLEMLHAVTYVGGNLGIKQNLRLPTLNGLDNIDYISGNLEIEQNPSLADLSSLQDLDTINGNLILTNLTGASDLYFLSSLDYVGGKFSINNNPDLLSLRGLEELYQIDGPLFIRGNHLLTSLTGLSGLHHINGLLEIRDNPRLTSIYGLHTLQTLNGHLTIRDNATLPSLQGLHNLDAATINSISFNFDDVTIRDNPLLEVCHTPTICDALSLPGHSFMITNNAGRCATIWTLSDACASPVLPVEGLQFEAQLVDADVWLHWSTEIEINSLGFEVQRSVDGQTWTGITWVDSSPTGQYQYIDTDLLSDDVYYRLEQRDYDGNTSVSAVRYVSRSKTDRLPYPNPVQDLLRLGTAHEVNYTVLDGMGRIVMRGQGVEVDMTTTPPGIYMVVVETMSHRIIKL